MPVSDLCLYVMQNEHGCIKIGRSVNVLQRRQSLVSITKRDIAVVCSFPKSGELEERLLLAVREYRLLGEWYAGLECTRNKIIQIAVSILASDVPKRFHNGFLEEAAKLLTPPFEWDEKGAEAWVEEFRESQARPRIRKERVRLIARLKAASAGMYQSSFDHLNFDIFFELFEREKRSRNPCYSVAVSWKDAPKYVSDAKLARELWPEGTAEAEIVCQLSSDATALEVCIAGLGARWDIDWRPIKARLN